MNYEDLTIIFTGPSLHAALMLSLLTVWLLVGLFAYLNHYTQRAYFTVWTNAWLFYALWLTLGLGWHDAAPDSIIYMIGQICVGVSAVFLLWGSLLFLGLPVQQRLFGLFMLFLAVWAIIGSQMSENTLQLQLPVFILLGCASTFASLCFLRMRKRVPFVGATMLCSGFLLWGFYLASYPLTQAYENLYSASFFTAAVLQIYLAISMIVLVLEEARHHANQVLAEIAEIRKEKEALQGKIITTEEECHNLYDQVRASGGIQQAYDELRRTQQVVVQQERLRALGQMASGVAHDVNNALSPIVAYSELLLNTLPGLSEMSRQHLKDVQMSAEDIAKIVARMRSFYRRRSDSEQLVRVDVPKVIEEVIELTRPRWRDLVQRSGISIQIQRELEPQAPLLLSDNCELREALINLVFNAVDALPRGGTITFVTRSVHAPALEPNAPVGRQLQVEVRDNGIGMDERTRQRCLEPFFSTKIESGGSGLGLSMVYGMMQRHNGTIEIDSTLGHGTCVRLNFPILEMSLPTAASPEPQVKSDRSLSLLCIDDEPGIRELLSECLMNFNHRVTVVASGKQALELFHTARLNQQPYEAVVTDLGMPELDGRQVARAIKAESPNTPVIMMTGWGTMMKEDGEKIPEVDYVLSKPLRMEELNNLLLRVTARPAAQGTISGATNAGNKMI